MILIKPLSIFLGTVIGVGIFSIPYVAFKAGFFIFLLYILVMALVVFFIQSIYGKIALGTSELHRLPGYVEKYMGSGWKRITFLVTMVGMIGSSLAYLIVAGEFLSFLFAPYFGGSLLIYVLVFFIPGAYLILRGIKSISFVEIVLLFILFALLIVFFIKSFPSIDVSNFQTLNLKFGILPYGVVLFSLWGMAVVPELKEMLVKLKSKDVARDLRRITIWGIIICVLTYVFFAFIVLGASGALTSKEAISGLDSAIGGNVIKLGYLFGVIACFTSFITLGLTFKKMFWYDFGLNKNVSWAITCFVPLILFILGLREFIDIIGFTGAVSLGAEGIIVVFMYKQFLKKKHNKRINPFFYILSGVFLLGIIVDVLSFLNII